MARVFVRMISCRVSFLIDMFKALISVKDGYGSSLRLFISLVGIYLGETLCSVELIFSSLVDVAGSFQCVKSILGFELEHFGTIANPKTALVGLVNFIIAGLSDFNSIFILPRTTK